MMFGGRSMGGGGGGGSMFRTVSRAALTRTSGVAIQEPISSASSNSTTASATTPSSSRNNSSNLCISSPTSPNCGPLSAGPNRPTSPQFDDFDWVSVDGSEHVEKAHGFIDDFALGHVPSRDEVHTAVSALQQVFGDFGHTTQPQFIRDKFGSEYLDKDVVNQITGVSSSARQVSSFGSESDWIEPSAYLCNSQIRGCERVYNAFHLLQNESSVQRMVVSLSSDKAVWDAVMNNEAVKELRESFYAAEDNTSQSSSENPDDDNNTATNFLRWIFQNTIGKVMGVIENITKVLDHLFQGSGKAKSEAGNLFEERLRSSVVLSVVVLLVVVVTRTCSA